ncbi:MAG: hypothetical protein AB7K24_26555 [Gemmataceae bacterium]
MQLNRDKRAEELEQLKLGRKYRWITPGALAVMFPMLGGLGLWVIDQMKQYEGTQYTPSEEAAAKDTDRYVADSRQGRGTQACGPILAAIGRQPVKEAPL